MMQKVIAVSLLALVGTACSSGTDTPTSTTTGNPIPPAVPTVRIQSVIVDIDSDEIPDRQISFDYDDAGRVVSHTRENFSSTLPNSLDTFGYENGLLVSVVNRFFTTNIAYEDGRPVLFEEFFNGELTPSDVYSFTFDASGRLSGFVGESLLGGSDCDDDAPIMPGAPLIDQASTVENTVTYENNRLKSIASTDGSTITLFYDANGRIVSLESASLCGDEELVSTVMYGYRADGKPQTIETMEDDGSTSSQTITYDAMGRASGTESTSTDAFDNSISTAEFSFQYDAQDLLVKTTSVERDFDAGSSTPSFEISSTLMFSYETEACVPQTFVNPVLDLFVSARSAQSTAADLPFTCGYYLEFGF